MDKELFLNKLNYCKQVFGSDYENVVNNLKIVYDAYTENLIERKDEFKILINFYNVLNSNIPEMTDTLKDYDSIKIQNTLYDAIKDCQYASFEDIKKHSYNLNEKDFDENLSNNYGVKIYNIKKSNTNLLISTTSWSKKYNNDYDDFHATISHKPDFSHHLTPKRDRKNYQDYKSLSFVDNTNLKTYRDLNKYVTLVYFPNIPNEHLITISSDDAFVEFSGKDAIYSNKKPTYTTSKDLLEKTRYFNEIAVLRSNQYAEDSEKSALKPQAIFCVNNISTTDLEIAKQYNLPIIFSESHYKFKDVYKTTKNYFKTENETTNEMV